MNFEMREARTRLAALVERTERVVEDAAESLVSRRVCFAGGRGLKDASDSFSLDAPQPGEFEMQAYLFSANGIDLRLVHASAHSGTRGLQQMEQPLRPSLELTNLVRGQLQADYLGRECVIEPGQLVLTRSDSTVQYTAECPITAFSIRLPPELVPAGATNRSHLPDGPLPQSRLVDAVAAFIATLVTGPRLTDLVEARLFTHALTELAISTLSAAATSPAPDDGPSVLRRRVLSHIDQHLTDTDLSPSRIAAEFHISVRYLHLLFQQHDTTVARVIRTRRLDAVRRHLTGNDQRLTAEHVATRFGFSSPEQLRRGYQARFGTSISSPTHVPPNTSSATK